MSEYEDMTFDETYTKFAERDTVGCLVWGAKLKLAHEREIAAKDTEVERLREIVEGLLKASTVECASCDYDCGQNRENCIIREAAKYIEES